MPDEQFKPPYHSEAEIRDYIVENYDGLSNAKSMAVGMVGNIYRVAVTDQLNVIHTLKIDPKSVEAFRKAALTKVAAEAAAKRLSLSGRGSDDTAVKLHSPKRHR